MKKLLLLFTMCMSIGFAYAQSTDAAMTTQFNVIRNETVPGANTKGRIADAYQVLNDSKSNINQNQYVIASGTDTYTASLTPPIASLLPGQKVYVKFTNANTGAATLNLNLFGAVDIRKMLSGTLSALVSGDIYNNQVFLLVYDGSYFQLIGFNSLDPDLLTIAGLSPSNNDVMQYKSGAWANRTLSQVKTDLAYTGAQITNTPAGNISATDVQAALNELDGEKQATLISGTTLKTVGGTSLLGPGDVPVGTGTVTTVSVTTANGVSGSVATATTTPAITLTLGAIAPTSVNGVVISGSSTPTLAVSGTATVSGPNTGDQTSVTGNAGTATALATGRTIGITGDVTYTSPSFDGTGNVTASSTVTKINGTSLAALSTGILKNTTTTGVPSIAVAGDFPTLNQNTSGSAATLTTPRAIYGNNFDGSAALTQIIASTYGGTGNGFTKFTGPTTSEKTFTLPNASATVLTDNAAVTVAQGGSGAATLTGALVGNGTSAFVGSNVSLTELNYVDNATSNIQTQLDAVTIVSSVSVTGAITLDATAFGKVHVVTGTSADYTIGLPTAVGNTGKTIIFQFSTALTKLITLDGNSTETINTALTKVYWAGENLTLISNGTNYTILNYTGVPMISSMTKSNQSVAYNSTVKISLDVVNLDNTGFCANVSSGRVDIKRTGTYLMKCRTQSSAIVALTTDIIQTFYKNGSNTATTGAPSGIAANLPFYMFNEGIAITLTAGDYIEINIFHDTTGSIARTFTCSLTILEIL